MLYDRISLFNGDSKATVDLNGRGFAEIRKVIAHCISYGIKKY